MAFRGFRWLRFEVILDDLDVQMEECYYYSVQVLILGDDGDYYYLNFAEQEEEWGSRNYNYFRYHYLFCLSPDPQFV